jgi:hypothetical protein
MVIQPAKWRKGAEIMNSTNDERMNLPTRKSLRAKSYNDVIAFANDGRLQSKPGYELQKLRLELAHSVSGLILTSKHASNDNDYSINIVRASHMPVSA